MFEATTSHKRNRNILFRENWFRRNMWKSHYQSYQSYICDRNERFMCTVVVSVPVYWQHQHTQTHTVTVTAVLYCTVLRCYTASLSSRHPERRVCHPLVWDIYSTVLYSALLYSALLYCALLYWTVLYSALFYCALFCSARLYFALLYSALLYCASKE